MNIYAIKLVIVLWAFFGIVAVIVHYTVVNNRDLNKFMPEYLQSILGLIGLIIGLLGFGVSLSAFFGSLMVFCEYLLSIAGVLPNYQVLFDTACFSGLASLSFLLFCVYLYNLHQKSVE